MTKIRVLKIIESTTVDGPGLRTSIYCAGCNNACPGCHNPQSWDINNGTPMTIDYLMSRILDDELCNVTFSGGDPMLQALPLANLAQRIKKETSKNIWCYTGYTFEQCLANHDRLQLLKNIDALVDGPFIIAQKDTDLLFRGSGNQRIIDVPTSLATGQTVLLHPEDDILPNY